MERCLYKKIANIDHDEPWLTLVSLFSLFGNQVTISPENINAFQNILNNSGFIKKIHVDHVIEVSIEKILPEIKKYRHFLYSQLEKGKLHLYPDRNKTIMDRLNGKLNKDNKRSASLEGNTNLDVQIVFEYNNRRKYLFIEAKFLSDIDTKTTYNPVRNQIIRNIDAMLDFVDSKEARIHGVTYDDVYFSVLTPKIFRTNEYGGNRSTALDVFTPQRSRYYCYVMDEYRNLDSLKKDLPHRKLSDVEWTSICNNIGWMTFEDI